MSGGRFMYRKSIACLAVEYVVSLCRYAANVERNPEDYDALYNWALVLQVKMSYTLVVQTVLCFKVQFCIGSFL